MFQYPTWAIPWVIGACAIVLAVGVFLWWRVQARKQTVIVLTDAGRFRIKKLPIVNGLLIDWRRSKAWVAGNCQVPYKNGTAVVLLEHDALALDFSSETLTPAIDLSVDSHRDNDTESDLTRISNEFFHLAWTASERKVNQQTTMLMFGIPATALTMGIIAIVGYWMFQSGQISFG